MAGYRNWTPGEVLTADNVQDYLQDQTVMVFEDATARGTAIVSPTEGMLTWIEDANKYQYWNGSAWSDVINALGAAGTTGQALVSNGTAGAAFGDVKAEFISLTLQDKTAAYTAVASDANTVLNYTSSGTVVVPDVLTSVGDRIDIIANTAGSVVIAAGTGVTSWAGSGTAGTAVTYFIDTPYSAASVIKTGASAYRVLGRISA
jgi:hypothetical protein